jgi:hypothetical protein
MAPVLEEVLRRHAQDLGHGLDRFGLESAFARKLLAQRLILPAGHAGEEPAKIGTPLTLLALGQEVGQSLREGLLGVVVWRVAGVDQVALLEMACRQLTTNV